MRLKFTPADLATATQVRSGERKLGEASWRPPEGGAWLECIDAAVAAGVRFVVLGLAEDLGVQANHGVAGAAGAWDCALPGIANVQGNRFLPGMDVWIAGSLAPDVPESHVAGNRAALIHLREDVAAFDVALEQGIGPLFDAGLHPVFIGGGNNNSLPILRALAACTRRNRDDARIFALNCDPHADFRAMEGRHSGNPFRHAVEEGTIERYFALLLHRNYNNEESLEAMEAANSERRRVGCNWFDDVLEGTIDLDAALAEAVKFLAAGDATGLELDCDAIAGFPASAYTPSGLSLDQARALMLKAARALQPSYLHLCEAAPTRTADGDLFVRKALALLATDHLRAMSEFT